VHLRSIVVGGQTVPVASNGGWTAQVPLSPGTNTITALATDGAGATAQANAAAAQAANSANLAAQRAQQASDTPPTATPQPAGADSSAAPSN